MMIMFTNQNSLDDTLRLQSSNSFETNKNVIISQDVIELAFNLISDASMGRITNFERTGYCLKFYRLYLNKIFRVVRTFFHLAIVILIIFDASGGDCKSLSSKITVSVECLCLSFYSFQLFVVYKFTNKEKFVRDTKHCITFIIILISIVDIILYMNRFYQFRISPSIRILLFINSSEQSQIRRHIRTLRMTIIDVLVILPFLLTFYFMMVFFIYRYFKTSQSEPVYYYNGNVYMQNFTQIIWETLVFITSANSPDVMLPAFSKSPLVGIIFLIFYASFFFLLSFIYGLIMGHFRDNAKKEMRELIIGKMSLVYDAFLILSEKRDVKEYCTLLKSSKIVSKHIVTKENWELLIQRFKKFRNFKPASSLFYSLLSKSEKPYLTKSEFMQIADLLEIPLIPISGSLHFFEKRLWFLFSNKLADFVESRYFNLIIGIIIVINSICITFTNERYTELFFTVLFLIEIFIRVYVKGFSRYFLSFWNMFDFVVILLAFAFWFVENAKLDIQTTTFTLLVLRNLRLLKLLRGIIAYKNLLHILGMLIPTIASLLTIVYSFIVLFVCIGIWCYRGYFFKTFTESDYRLNSSNCNNSLIKDIDFGRLHYCILSFNSFISGFETLSAVAIGNNWQVITEGYELISGEVILTRIYFAIFKLVITYLLLLIVAFVLDVFLLAYNHKSSLPIEKFVNNKLNDLQIQFISYKTIRDSRKIIKKSALNGNSFSFTRPFKKVEFEESNKICFRLKCKGARSVEYISQAMFQSEIEKELHVDMKYMHLFEME